MAETTMLQRLWWPVCEDGYEIRWPDAKPKGSGRRGAQLYEPGGKFIFPKSGRFQDRPVLENEGRHKAFATCRTDADILDFVKNSGLPTAPRRRYSVRDFVDRSMSMRSILRAADEHDWASVSRWLDAAGKDSASGIGGIGRLGVVFEIPPSQVERPKMHLRAGTLYSAMLFQALEDISQGTLRRECALPGCSVWFAFGPGRKHRETAKYCCDAHRYAHRDMERK